jgi:reactive intermediate/imine deaminase
MGGIVASAAQLDYRGRVRPLSLLLALVAGCASAPPPPAPTRPIEHINLVEPWPYPFSSAVRAGNLVYLSGQIGTRIENGGPKLVEGGVEAETRQALDNIKDTLAKAGTSLDNVVSCMVMMADMNEWPAMNKVYASYFPGPKPARSAWGATALALGARLEISCIAAMPPRK